MAIRNTILGGTDWANGEVLYGVTDLNDTFNTVGVKLYGMDTMIGNVPFVLGANGVHYVEALDTSSGEITLTSGKTYRVASMNIATNDLVLSGGTAGVPTVIICEGNAVISSNIVATAGGYAGGGSNVNGSSHVSVISGVGLGHGFSGATQAAGTFVPFATTPSNNISYFNVLAGAGGGGGSPGDQGGSGGGAGGGSVIIICKGNFTGTSGTINVSGTDGGAGGGPFGSNKSAGGAGGGGAGGTIVLAYGGSYAAATYNVSGGDGGAAGVGDVTHTAPGGAGGGGASGPGSNGTAGEAAPGTTNSGAGGDGGDGAAYIFAI